MPAATLLIAWTCMAAEPKLTFEGAERHPTVNVTPEDVARARKRIKTDPAAKAWFASLQKSVAGWNDKDPAWVKSVMPAENACFAYGFTGCPICGGRWSSWGRARCSLDNPGMVKCSGGHLLPDKDHSDSGKGYRAPDGRIHYFVGSYNAWIVETLIFKIAKPYARIYTLTGDERAGLMTAVVLDEIARIYPSCDSGSWDYPSNPPSGRLCRPWYQVARVLVHFVDMYDWIFDHPALDEPSSRTGLTRRRNIEKNLLLNGAKYCYDMSIKQGGLHNGQADYLRGVLSVGVVLGIPEYVKWPVDGTYGIRAMLANNVDRDGRYFETASGYALHTRGLYLTFSEPLLNYRGSVFPNGLNLYDDPKFESFFVLPQMATVCLGHDAAFGDAAPKFRRKKPPYRPSRIYDLPYAEYLASRMSDPKKQARYAALLDHLRALSPAGDKTLKGTTDWRVFCRPDELPAGGKMDERMKRYLDGSFFVGQKGLAVLRLSKGADAHAAIMRFGPSLVHGHLDDLNINYHADGYEMTYDQGYSLGSTHTQVGWAKQTVSHNVVVVDEKSHGGGTFGGSLLHFAVLPGLALAEGSSTVYAHAGVDVYRRLFALTDDYALDVFRVKGGRQHDLPLHGLSTDVAFANLKFAEPRPGSLAGKKYKWGELQLNDGDMKGYPSKPYWNPPPGNGYGFLSRPAFAEPSGNWSATWQVAKNGKTRFQLLAVHGAGTEVIQAVAPALYPTFPKARHVIRRRKGKDLSSCFVSVWQSFAGSPPVKAVRRIDAGSGLSAGSAVAVAVDMTCGRRDIWCVGPDAASTVSARDGNVSINAKGAIARCRLDDKGVVSAELLDAYHLDVAGWRFGLDHPSRAAQIAELPIATSHAMRTRENWIDDGRYDGDPLYASSSRYSRNSAYTIMKASGDTVEVNQAGTILGRGTVAEVTGEGTLTTKVPHEYARSVARRRPSGFFRGKLLRTRDGSASAHIKRVRFGAAGMMGIDVDSTNGFAPGQTYYYHDVQPGDTLTVQHRLSIVRRSDREYELRTNTSVTVRPPGGAKVMYVSKSGRAKEAVGGVIPRGDLPRSGLTTVTVGG